MFFFKNHLVFISSTDFFIFYLRKKKFEKGFLKKWTDAFQKTFSKKKAIRKKISTHTIFVCWKKIGRKTFFRYCTQFPFFKKMFYIAK